MGAIGFLKKPIEPDMLLEAFGKMEAFFLRHVKKLLVVEDNEIERKSIAELIGDGDVETKMVGLGKEALELLKSEKFDCMILDLNLPDMTGFELLEKLEKGKESIPRPPVIVYTGKDLSNKEDDQTVYCVEDNGLGIHEESQIIIFELFHRLDPKKSEGEGVGLNIVSKIIQWHCGKRVEFQPGRGSKFFVSLPNKSS